VMADMDRVIEREMGKLAKKRDHDDAYPVV